MAYNEYDDPHFFQEYAKMGRSQGGLPAAGEWHQLQPLFPPLEGKAVLDLGCGYGWHCKYAAEQGAAEVLGIDLSHRMIAEAEQRNADSRITYRVCGIEDYEYPAERWDCVVSNLALHYIADLDAIYRKVRHTLRPGGVFLFNIEHPVFTARPGQDWIYDEAGQPLYWPVDGGAPDPLSGLRGEKAASHPHPNLDGIAHQRFCHRRGGGSPALPGDAGLARDAGRTAPPHDAAGEGRSTKRISKNRKRKATTDGFPLFL